MIPWIKRSALLMAILLAGCTTNPYAAWREYQRGLDLFKGERYEEAQEHVRTSLSIQPNRPEVLALLGWTYVKQGRFNEARDLFTRVYEMDRASVYASQGFAWVDYSTNDYDGSERWFKKEFEWANKHMENTEWVYYGLADNQYIVSIRSDAEYGLGLIALARGKPQEARSFFLQSLRYPNAFIGHGPILAALGDSYSAAEDHRNGLLNYEKSLAVKNDSDIAVKRAWSLYNLGDHRGADNALMQILGSSTDRRSCLYALVFTKHRLGDLKQAKGFLKELIQLDPYVADTAPMYQLIIKTEGWRLFWKDFADVYFEKGDFARASYKLQGYLELKKTDCPAPLMNAWCSFHLEGPKTGLEEFTRLSERRICPSDQVRTGKGVSLLYMGRLAEADTEFQKASMENPQNLRAHVARGAVAFLKGDYPGAIEIYEKYLERLPKSENYFSWPSHALNNLGWSYIKTGKYQEAVVAFKRLEGLHRNPAYPEIFDGLGWSLFRLHRPEEAKAAFEKALRLSPGYSSSISGLSAVDAQLKGKRVSRPLVP